MNNLELANSLELELVTTKNKEININGVYIGDLLSVVMSKAKEDYAWMTIQTHLNIVAVAELLEIACIIVVEDMEIDKDTINKANELEIPIFKTKQSAYQVACRLCNMGIK